MQNNYKFRKKKKEASMHASNQVLQQHETTTVPLRQHTAVKKAEQIVHYIRDKCNKYVTISILGRSG